MKGAVGFGAFSTEGGARRVGFRVGESVLDLAAAGLGAVFEAPTLNPFLALGRSAWEDVLTRVRGNYHLFARQWPNCHVIDGSPSSVDVWSGQTKPLLDKLLT